MTQTSIEEVRRALELGKTVQAAEVNVSLVRALRKVLTMVERGELVAGVFVGLARTGSCAEMLCVPTGPAQAIVATATRVAATKLEAGWMASEAAAPVDTSSIIKVAG